MKRLINLNRYLTKISPVVLIIIFMIIGISQYIFYNQDMDLHLSEMKDMKRVRSEMEWTLFVSTLKNVQEAANEKADHNAISIINDIRIEYPDMNVLKKQFDYGEMVSTRLPYIVYQNLCGNQLFGIHNGRNDGLVLSRDGYIFESDALEHGKSWHTFGEESKFNAKLLYDTMEAAIRVNDLTITYAAPEYNSSGEFISSELKSGTIEDLKMIYDENGLGGFKDFTFFGKAYITETGDVFGTPDISPEAKKTNNHKLIVIQKFNMFDIMTYHHASDLYLMDDHFMDMKKNLEHGVVTRTLTYLTFMILDLVSMLIIIFCTALGKKNTMQN